jgi:hypothetical protein
MGGDHQSRRAEAALNSAGVEERLLHRIEHVAVGQSLDRHDAASFGLARGNET